MGNKKNQNEVACRMSGKCPRHLISLKNKASSKFIARWRYIGFSNCLQQQKTLSKKQYIFPLYALFPRMQLIASGLGNIYIAHNHRVVTLKNEKDKRACLFML